MVSYGSWRLALLARTRWQRSCPLLANNRGPEENTPPRAPTGLTRGPVSCPCPRASTGLLGSRDKGFSGRPLLLIAAVSPSVLVRERFLLQH